MLGLKLICHIIAGLYFFTAAHAVYVPEPVALYPLNATYTTQEINNRQPQGTSVGVSLAPGPDGKPGGSYQFTGNADSYIEFPNDGGLDVKHSFTLLCWVYPESSEGPLFHYGVTKWGTHFWLMNARQPFVRIVRGEDYDQTLQHAMGASLPLNQWHYVGASYDSDSGVESMWVDGIKVVEKNIGDGVTHATQEDVRMGSTNVDLRKFKGRIARMQVYDVALTAEQIIEVQEDRVPVSVPYPVALYPLNSKCGTRELDNFQPQGTPVGVSLAPGPDGKPGGSYQFTGNADSYIEFPNDGGLDVKHSFTLLCWVYPESSEGPLFHYGTDTERGTHFGLVNERRPFVRIERQLVMGTALALNQWHYVGASYDYATGVESVWVDGARVAEKNIGAGVSLATQEDARMGSTSVNGLNFRGRLTRMQVYDVALTAEQIEEVKEDGRDIDECAAYGVVCHNGGTCVNQCNGYTCECQSDYIGDHCEWKKMGCYKEVDNRADKAMPKVFGKFREYRKDISGAVEACMEAAEEKQLDIFGVRNRYVCATTKGDSDQYDRHGKSGRCNADGKYEVGKRLAANYVYVLSLNDD